MAMDIGTLTATLQADTAGFDRSMNSAGDSVDNFEQDLSSSSKRVAKWSAGIVAAAASAATALSGVMVASEVQTITATKRLADQLGVTFAQMEALTFAAQQQGIEQDQLKETIGELTQRLGEAAAGEGQAAEVIKRLGLNARELNQMQPAEAFKEVAEVVSNLPDRQTQFFAADQFFGGQGREIINLLDEGRSGIESMVQTQQRLQGEMTRMEATQVERVSQAWDRMGTAISSVWRTLSVQLAPILANVMNMAIDAFVRLRESAIPQIKALWDFFTNAVVQAVEFVSPILIAWGNFVFTFWRKIGQVTASVLETVMGWLGQTGNTLGRIQAVFQGFRDAMVIGFTTIEVIIQRWRDVVELVFVAASFYVTRFANQVHHFFTEVIPSTVMWFANNWREIFTDVFNWTTTVFSNLASNIVDIVKNIPALVTGETSFGELWTPLTEGFRATLSELPDIAEREAGAMEKALGKRMGQISGDLGDEISKRVGERLEMGDAAAREFENSFEGLGELDLNLEGMESNMEGVAQNAERARRNVDAMTGQTIEVSNVSRVAGVANPGTLADRKRHEQRVEEKLDEIARQGRDAGDVPGVA